MLNIRPLLNPSPLLQFHLEAQVSPSHTNFERIKIQGWIACRKNKRQLIVQHAGRIQPLPSEQITTKISTAPLPLHKDAVVHGFSITMPAEQFIAGGTMTIGVEMQGMQYWLYTVSTKQTTPRGFLLGGSNALIRGGLWLGLTEHLPELKNKGLGKSTSLQNLFELLRHNDEIPVSDFIITESNVNDSLAASSNSSVSVVLQNIDWFYKELSKYRVPVYILLFPLQLTNNSSETPELVAEVNDRHCVNARRYGFHLIDLAANLAPSNEGILDCMMADTRHPLPIFMYQLGKNLAKFIIGNRRTHDDDSLTDTPLLQHQLQHEIYLFEEYQANKRNRANSAFDEWVLPLNEEAIIPDRFIDKQLIGAFAWCDEPSSVEFANKKSKVIATFRENCSFFDFDTPFELDEGTTIRASLRSAGRGALQRIFRPRKSQASLPGLIGLLFRNKNATLEFPPECGAFPLNNLIPRALPYISNAKFIEKHGKKTAL